MKKLFAAALLTVSVFGSFAMANDQLTMGDVSQGVVIQPLNGNCTPTPQGGAQPMNGYCDSRGDNCPIGTVATPKYCWGGMDQGWYRCGTACRFDPYTGGQ